MPDEEEILSWPIWAVVPTCLAIVFPLIAEPFINLIAKASVMHSLACGIVTVARTMSPSFGLFLAINIDVALAVYSGNHHETALTLSCYCRSCIDAARAAIFGLKRATDLLLTVTFWTFDALSDIIGELPALYVSLILLVGLCNLAAAVYIAFPLALLREVVGNLNYYRFVDAILSTGGRMARTLLGLAAPSLEWKQPSECDDLFATWVLGLLGKETDGCATNHNITLQDVVDAATTGAKALLDWLDGVPA